MSTHQILLTLYCLVIGTLLTAAAMTQWERQSRPRYGDALCLWSVGYLLLASGCGVAAVRLLPYRPWLPLPAMSMASNFLVLAGYLVLHQGVARLDRRSRIGFALAVLGFNTLLWLVWGLGDVAVMWTIGCAAQIALTCFAAAFDLARNRDFGAARSIPVVVSVFAVHGAVYLARGVLLPVFGGRLAARGLELVAEATLYEGVVFSVALPMALLLLLREEADGRMRAALRTDYLTGLGNRQMLVESAPGLIAASGNRRVALMLFDLDHFKQVNDRHGHAAGDVVLRCFAGAGTRVVGDRAVFARLGGEEFAMLMPVANLTEAALVAETVLQRFSLVPAIAGGVCIPATASAGVALLHPNGGLPELMRDADAALYEAKALGRNRVVVAGTAAAPGHPPRFAPN